ncbi:Twin-arginine translocation pathway signal precursor [Bosea sp. LC85]|uniref:alkaline phosphatase D family protein n=1 Tax=Bosea sp. LC85 TaxID=1502851 RepID=UPI0004E3AAF8|nr:alkaline phosphatase D family protein [Bosea sp. LC85]KFC70396.1 Twin-arginine translocation pathway signal precursor [Bosea sp. LC85]
MFRRNVFGRFIVDDFLTDAGTPSRRRFLQGLAASGLLLTGGGMLDQRVWANPVFAAYPFGLGIASGDPSADGFVIWTKLAPLPLARNGGMPMKAVEVTYEIGSEANMRQVVQRGSALARPELGHAVHVEVSGLEPNRDYFYRFTCGGERTMTGRARTFPAANASIERAHFGVLGCQRYEDGYFTAFRHVADEHFDFIYHYGDYIYEYRMVRPNERPLPVARVMPGDPDEIYSLADYRHRYAIYKSDPDLQLAHASAPWLVSFDDHEVDNNFAGLVSEQNIPPEIFALRRAAGFQAWYEHMPLRRASIPNGPSIQAYRRFLYGDLAQIDVLDTRQSRSDQPCGDGSHAACTDALKPDNTMLGEKQEAWLAEGLRSSGARWNVLAQQVMVMRHDRDPDPKKTSYSMDKWDGAVAARQRLFDTLDSARTANAVVLTGDIHQNWAGELKANFDDPKSRTLGVEFVATSITSGGDGADMTKAGQVVLQKNPHIGFFNNQRGYMRHIMSQGGWQADYRVLDRVTTAGGAVSTRASFVVEAGKPGMSPK